MALPDVEKVAEVLVVAVKITLLVAEEVLWWLPPEAPCTRLEAPHRTRQHQP